MTTDAIRTAGASYLRDYVTDGVPASGVNEPVKSAGRATFNLIADEIDDVLAGQQAGLIRYATWAELAAHSTVGLATGDAANVIGVDAGTHTDPIVGGTVDNKGVYRYQTGTPNGWKRLGDLAADDATDAAAAAAASAANALTVASDSLLGLFNKPNLLMDPNYIMLGSGFDSFNLYNLSKPTLTTSRGRPAAIYAATSYQDYPVERFGGAGAKFSATLTVEDRVDPAAGAFIYFQQHNGSGEIGGSSIAFVPATGASDASEQVFTVDGATIHASATFLRRYFFVPGGCSFTVSREGMYAGELGAFRPALSLQGAVYVATDGDDETGLGTVDSPYATGARARVALFDRSKRMLQGRVIYRGGWYGAESYTLGDLLNVGLEIVDNLEIEAAPGEDVHWLHGALLSGIAKTGGYTNIYQGSLTGSPLNFFIFEHLTPESQIPADEVHPAQRGGFLEVTPVNYDTLAELNADLAHIAGVRARVNADGNTANNGFYVKVGGSGSGSWSATTGLVYHSPSTRLQKVDSLAVCDATPGSWYWAANVLYFHAPGSTDPTSSGKSYYVPDRDATATAGRGVGYGVAEKTGRVCVRGITIWYPYKGVDLADAASSEVVGVTVIGPSDLGFSSSFDSVEINCRAIAPGLDGFGSDNNGQLHTRPKNILRIGCYSVLTGDDGTSDHRRVSVKRIGCLDEYSGDAGCAPALGASVADYDCTVRKPGRRYGLEIAGESAVAGEGLGIREAGRYVGHGTVAIASPNCNFSAGTSPGIMRLYRARSEDGAVCGYIGDQVGGFDGDLYLHDCTDVGSATAKIGTPTVRNGTLVT